MSNCCACNSVIAANACVCGTCGCDQRRVVHTYESLPVNDVKYGKNVRVSDRNGFPKDLKSLEHSVPHTNAYGAVENRDGSTGKPLTLKLQELSGNGIPVVFTDDDGVDTLGKILAVDPSKNYYVLLKGNQVSLVEQPTIRACFDEDEVPGSQTGQLALLTCGPDGSLCINRFTGCGTAGPLMMDVDGNVTCDANETCDDSEEQDDFSALKVCREGSEIFLAPQAGKMIVGCEVDGTPMWLLKDKGLMFYPVEPVSIWSSSAEIESNTPVAVPNPPDPICEDGPVYVALIGIVKTLRLNTAPTIELDLFVNDNLIASTSQVIYYQGNGDGFIIAKVTGGNIQVRLPTASNPATNTFSANLKLLGYFV